MTTLEVNYASKVQHLISKGETEKAIELAKKYLKEKNSVYYDDCLILSNQFYGHKRDYRMDLVEEREPPAKIILGLLNLIKQAETEKDIKKEKKSSKVSEEKPNVDFHAQGIFANFNQDSNQDSNFVKKVSAPEKVSTTFKTPKVESENITISNYKLASKLQRLGAVIVESMIFLFILAVVSPESLDYFDAYLLEEAEEPISFVSIIFGGVIAGIIRMAFYPIFSGNLGHRIVGLKVVHAETGKDFKTAKDGFLREFVKSSGLYFILPVIWLLFDKHNQNLYDKLMKSVVVRRK